MMGILFIFMPMLMLIFAQIGGKLFFKLIMPPILYPLISEAKAYPVYIPIRSHRINAQGLRA
jgi:hypothetical protein